MRLYPEEERSEVSVLSTESNKPLARSLFRKVVPLAAVIAVVFMTMIAVQAAGVDVFGSLARWTEETFRFTGGDSTPAAETARPQVENETYLAIQAEVDKLDIDIPVVPTWFPEGYELQDTQLSNPDMMSFESIDCLFKGAENHSFVITIKKYAEGHDISGNVFEKDGQSVIQYLGGDKRFYIMSNNSRKTATWSNGQIFVSIGGDLSEDALKLIIDSIGG